MQSGFASRHFGTVIALAGLLPLAAGASAADLSLPISGNLLGSVLDSAGTPQMGAAVQVFNKYQRLVAKTLTNPQGRFAFVALPPDSYSIRVSLSSFLPASRDRVPVKAGADSVLQIHLATLFSSIEIAYTAPSSAMSDDWKWVLRSSPDTRLITRYLPRVADSSKPRIRPRLFSETHAMLSVSGGDSGPLDSESAISDLGTGFAVSTNLLGRNQLQVAGTYGQSTTIGPTGFALAAIYSRPDQSGFTSAPEITMSVTQVGGISAQPAQQIANQGMPSLATPLRSMRLSTYQTADPLDILHLEYGITGESIDYTQHTSRLTPFARATVTVGGLGNLVAVYSNGGRPDQLIAHQSSEGTSETAASDVSSSPNVAQLPQVSARNGRLELQRTQNYELGYAKIAGSITFGLSGFYESVSNGRLNLGGDRSGLDPASLLSDGVSEISVYNIGSYRRKGYIASVNQHVSDAFDVALAYGRMGGFGRDNHDLFAGSIVDQGLVEPGMANVASANMKARIPGSHTRVVANYGWADNGLVVPWHAFTTQDIYVARGFNVVVRQPLPCLFGMPGRFEITADLRNLLAQGYIPLTAADGQRMLIVQAPRSVRGGLNFIF